MKPSFFLKRLLTFILALDLILFPTGLAAQNIPGFYGSSGNLVQPSANQLPVIQSIVSNVSGLEHVGNNKLIVHQTDDKAVLEWKSFDIGANAWTYFDQQGNTNWSALNRIFDQNPSQIFGRLTADGSVYLINQNGMLFSHGARVDVHGLVASSLNIAQDAFEDDLMTFAAENYQEMDGYDGSAVAIANHGTMATDNDGMVMLIGPVVENNGSITSPLGTIILAAGSEVAVTENETTTGETYSVSYNGATTDHAVNFAAGSLDAYSGYIGMFGQVVNQEGLVKAVTAIRQRGRIVLKASDALRLGEESLTTSPISDSDEAVAETSDFFTGEITLGSEGPIDVKGSIVAPSGNVTISGDGRVYLDATSLIDVSGSWVVLPAEAAVASVQLNSVELKDDYAQKDSLLKGQTIYFNLVEGPSIGDVSGTLTTTSKTALERSTAGGNIEITSANGDVIARSGSIIDFSGGGIIYIDGMTDTTILVSGTDVYRIADAPDNLVYDLVISPDNPVADTNERFGMSTSYNGVYHTGSASAVHNYAEGYIQGDDAGSLNVIAPVVLLNGMLDGSVTAGIYQTEENEGTDDNGYQSTMGIERPKAGTLYIGGAYSGGEWADRDPVVSKILISAQRYLLDADFDVTSELPSSLDGLSIVAADLLNQSGLRDVTLSVRESIVVAADAVIRLDPTSSLTLAGRHIEHYGEIIVPDGEVSLILASNKSSDTNDESYIDIETLGYERIYLGSGSLIDVSGEHIDLTDEAQLDGATCDPGQIDGGTVILADWTTSGEGIIVMPEATVDVSGGWRIDNGGTVSGGNAGTIQISGASIHLDGDLYAYALSDADGGTIDLHAEEMTVTADPQASTLPEDFVATDPLTDEIDGAFSISDDQLDLTGASVIHLASVTDLAVDGGVILAPSTLRLAWPDLVAKSTDAAAENYTTGETSIPAGNGETIVRVTLDEVGESAITLRAGKTLYASNTCEYILPTELTEQNELATASIDADAVLAVAPQGIIGITAPSVEIAGQVSALAGNIDIEATSMDSGMALTIQSGARVSAAAYNLATKQTTKTILDTVYEALDGGSITLTAAADLIVAENAVLDVSASRPVDYLLLDDDGTYQAETVAGAPGTIDIAYENDFQLQGELRGQAILESMHGGTLSVRKTAIGTAYEVSSTALEAYIQAGFDDITLASNNELVFITALDANLERKFTLDAPVISTSNQTIAVDAPWIVLTNTYLSGDSDDGSAVAVGGVMHLSADWIDIAGDIILSGFDTVSLNATHDLRLEDIQYDLGNTYVWSGRLDTEEADLIIDADQVYPTTATAFSIVTSGNVTTRATTANPSTNPVYSAYGSLTLEAANIQHAGRWYAPMGQIEMTATAEGGRIYLGDDSLLSVAGETTVNYGYFDDEGIVWQTKDKTSSKDASTEIEDAPKVAVTLVADEVIMRDEATVDISGGGEAFGYQWIASVDGSTDPLDGVYVIVPGYSASLPGEAVYLAGNDLITEGVYTILDESYAFAEGAMVIEDLGAVTTANGSTSLTADGYVVSKGYTVVAGTNFSASQQHLFSVRSAEDALAEGGYSVESITAGDAGTFSITAGTILLNGTYAAAPLAEEYSGGTLALSSQTITASTTGAELPDGFTYTSLLPDDLAKQLIINASAISEGGFGSVQLGDASLTETVSFEAGSTLGAENITITATESITVGANSLLSASGEAGGLLTLDSPEGRLTVDESATLHATNEIAIDTRILDLDGDIVVDNSALTLASDAIVIVENAAEQDAMDGLVIDGTLWNKIWTIGTISLASRSDITFMGDVALQATGTLVMDSDSIVLDGGSVSVAASQILLQNTSLANEVFTAAETSANATGSIAFSATDMAITFGQMADTNADDDATNDLAVVGAAELAISVTNSLVVSGEGVLATDGDLDIESAALVTALIEKTGEESDDLSTVTVADAAFVAENGTFTTRSNGNAAETGSGYGGAITLQAASVNHGGRIISPSGTIRLTSTGTAADDGIYLRTGASLDVSGTDNAAGGSIFLEAVTGGVDIVDGAVVDVSAGAQGDAGSITIVAPESEARVAGNLYGQANGGTGGRFTLDTLLIDDLSGIANMLAAGGFDEQIDLLVSQGGLYLAGDHTLTAHAVSLTANSGTVEIAGTIKASGADGGSVEVNADTIFLSGKIDASAESEGQGGSVTLNAVGDAAEALTLSDARIDVSGGSGEEGGSVYFRAKQNEDRTDVNMRLEGTITGAASASVEGVSIYADVDTLLSDGASEAGEVDMQTLLADSQAWVDNLAFTHQLTGIGDDDLQVLAGVEIRSKDDLRVAEEIDFSDYGEYSAIGVLTLRSAGDLTVSQDIIDARTNVLTLRASTAQRSWGINMVAGADLDSSDFMAVSTSAVAGQLTIANDVRVYTESGAIRFASAGDTVVGSAVGSQDPMTTANMGYNIGSFSGMVEGYTGGDLIFQADDSTYGSGIQTATSDIYLTVSGDLVLANGNYSGAIRTVGQAPEPDASATTAELRLLSNEYWSYTNGGSIILEVGGDIHGKTLKKDAWDASSYNGLYYHAAYRHGGSKGIVAMAGGDVTIQADGDVTSAVGLFGEGGLTLAAGGSLNGRFLISEGLARLSAMENFGALENFDDQPIEAFDAQIELVAQGSIVLGTMLNPTIANFDYSSLNSWDLRYTEASSVSLTSVTGSVLLTGDTRFYDRLVDQNSRIRILPANLTIDAAGDIILGKSFYLAPSATGNLSLSAGGDIRSATSESSSQARYILAMSDVDPSLVYGVAENGKSVYQLIIDGYAHDDELLHQDDPVSAVITAGGDVRDLLFYIPKASTLIAGGDIANIYYHAQNINLDDTTVIAAGHDIYFSTGLVTVNNSGIEIGGAGDIVISAGNTIDLGSSEGIRAVGGIWNPALPTPDEAAGDPPATLTIYAGLDLDLTNLSARLTDTATLFDDIRELGQAYSEALAKGNTEGAQEILEDINENVINPYFDGAETGEGNINMVNSEIYTSGNAGHIYMVATGEMNVGKSTFSASSEENTGIYTTSGGSINIYVNGDLNVNESRVMTFLGGDNGMGDITVWSQEGNINAGKGSKTAITASAPTIDYDENGDPYVVWSPPSVGSGIRALTYDPDGPEGNIKQPDAGDIYLFAPTGQIDAGEAGIAGSNIILAAIEVVNVQNIEVGGAAVGVPDTSLAATSLGALAGSGAVSETSKVAEEQAGLSSAQDRFSKYVEDLSESLVPKWLAVEVIGFGGTEASGASDNNADTQ